MSAPPVFWWPVPALGDIVWCLWPNKGRGALPGPKPRPCLVLELDESNPGQPHVLVAYGTSKGVTSVYPGEFAITRLGHPHAYAAAGLSYDTKFHMGQTAWLPYSSLAFDVPGGAPHGQHPKLGTLHVTVFAAAQSAHKAAWP